MGKSHTNFCPRNDIFSSVDENISLSNPVAVSTVSSTVASISQPSQKYGNENVSPAKRAKITEPDEDMFTIPSSQNHPTQSRFSSQRSILARTQLILSIQRQPKNFFENALIKCGVGLDVMDCYVLTCNHLNFVTKIRELLKTSDNYPANIKDFICGIDDAMNEHATLTKLLSGCKLSLPSSDNIYQSQESIIKDFFMIDFLQKDLIEILFKRIELFVVDDETLKLDKPFVELMLSELKFVNLVEHGDFVLYKTFEIIESATVNYQQIIIRSLPDIVDVTKHNEAMEKLMIILPDDGTLLGFSNVDTFGNMHLNAGMRKRLRRKIIDHMMYKAPLDLFPSMVKFILRINSDEMEFLPQLILDFRHCLRWVITEENRNEVEINQKEVFQCILRSLTTSKPLYDTWLKIIQNTTVDNLEPIDLIILLLMIKVNEDKTYYIEQLIRKKIRSEQYSVKILEDIFKQFVSILTEYITVFISILDGFFRDKIPSIVSFACHGFKLLYSIKHCSNKVLLSKLVGYVCQNQLASSFDVATNALRILTEFNDTNPVQMQNYGLQLLTMLDRASDLTLTQYRMVMSILGSLAFPVPPMTGSFELQNHIDMLLKKQVSSSILTIKNLGIVGIVQTIEHLIWTNVTESGECSVVYESIDDIDDLAAKTAAQYLDLVLSATRNCPESLGLCFDELAAVISPKNKNQKKNLSVNKSFETWVSDFIVLKFQELFVVGVVPEDDIELIYQYVLNNPADNNTESEDIVNIAINIGGLTFKPTSSALSAVSLIPSFFNLLRISQFYRYGNLTTINALLGCAIVLPKCVNSPSEMNIFEDYDEVTAKRILDVYYLTVNWMRETISAFVTQEEKMLQKKVENLSNFESATMEVSSLLVKLLREILIENGENWTKIVPTVKSLLSTVIQTYQNNRFSKDIRTRILILLCDIVLSWKLCNVYGESAFAAWLPTLPTMLCQPYISHHVLATFSVLAKQKNDLFLKNLENLVPNVLENLSQIQVTGIDDLFEGKKMIANLLFWVDRLTISQDLSLCENNPDIFKYLQQIAALKELHSTNQL